MSVTNISTGSELDAARQLGTVSKEKSCYQARTTTSKRDEYGTGRFKHSPALFIRSVRDIRRCADNGADCA